MKRFIVVTVAVAALSALALAQMAGSRGSTAVDLGGGKATINYGTPVLGSRNLDDMIKPGTAWRMGSNDATTLETTVDLDFGGKKLAAGKYTLFARPDEKQNWTLLISNGTGAMFSASSLVLEAPLRFARESANQDVLEITLKKAGEGADLHVAWGAYRLQGSFKPAR